MNDKSYTELMKLSAMNRTQGKEFIRDLYIDMLLSEVQLLLEKEKLQEEIDKALDKRNKEKFLHLSKKLLELNKRYGT